MSQDYPFGIISVGSSLQERYPLVQSRCHYEILDVYTIANVVQDYYSQARAARDVEYVFPLPPSAAVCSFKAIIDDSKIIKGIVKEKGEAKREFREAVAQGKTAGLLQQEHADVFRVSLGNIQPNQKISVHISYVSIVPHDGNSPQSLRITMPTAIAPRYGQAPPNVPWFSNNTKNRFELTVAIQMSKPVTAVTSPSHLLGLTLGCAEKELRGDFDPTRAFVYLGDAAFLDKDIIIVIAAQGLDVPRCSVERWLASEGAEETTDAYALTMVPKFDLPALPSQEYIFLVDRSGSMAGGRMESVKTGLQIMLRSLPSENTTFNIISFGDHNTSLWPKSQMYTAETVAKASRHVDTFTASYGGTEIRGALRFALQSRLALTLTSSKDKTPASVFVLTDGEAWDLDGVVDVVTENVQLSKTQNNLLRTFVLGVGNQVSTAMCEGIARAGNGSAVFVATREKPDAKLMSLLKAARGAVIEDLTVDWGVSELEKAPEEEFEMVSGPSETGPVSPSRLPPINLFDEQTPSTDSTEVGPKKAIVRLPSPPVIQQAPKSDKLPIPLYPGFRCSIFAIVKQSSNPGPPSTTVRITGKVMGRDVSFQTPVIARSVGSDVTSRAIESGKLLHTLAAKALIQFYEDVPSTPTIKAHIERLGKRYSLASSVTSFLAIDEDSKRELRDVDTPTIPVDPDSERQGAGMACISVPSTNVPVMPCLISIPAYSPLPAPAARSRARSRSPVIIGVARSRSRSRSPQRIYVTRSRSRSRSPVRVLSLARRQSGSRSPPRVISVPASSPRNPPATVVLARSSYGISQRPRDAGLPSPQTIRVSSPPMPSQSGAIYEYDRVHRVNDTIQFMESDGPTQDDQSGSQVEYRRRRASATPAYGEYDPTIEDALENGQADYGPSPTRRYRPSSSQRVIYEESVNTHIGFVPFDAGEGASPSPFSRLLSFVKKKKRDSTSSLPDVRGRPSISSSSSSYTNYNAPPPDMLTTVSPPPVQAAHSRTVSSTSQRLRSSRMRPIIPRSTKMGPLTLETIVRSQQFNGSFPNDQAFLTQICGNKPVPGIPVALRDLTNKGNEGTLKMGIWATVLAVACLKRRFALEKDSWEIVVEKAMVFIKNALDGNDALADTLIADAEGLF